MGKIEEARQGLGVRAAERPVWSERSMEDR